VCPSLARGTVLEGEKLYETVLYEKDSGVADIALNRPERLNAFDTTMHDELYRTLGDAAQDEEIRSIVVRGEGRGFSAGADLAQVVRDAEGDPDLGEYLRTTYSQLVTRMVGIEKPLVAALHGPVYGAGVGLALACDLRVAAQSAKFSVAFIKIGLMPDAGVTFLLPASSASAELWR
jgi:2-(1,2-epoxy-1,2-dihydrophenyl)acetyl-CoA isomerase